MKTFLKRYWAIILLVAILITISVLSFVPDKYLLSNDNYSPELNPLLTIFRSLISPAWRSYRVLGFASDSEQADIFRTGLMGLLSTVAPISSVAQIFSLISLWVGVLSMAFLTSLIARNFVKTKYTNLVFLIAGVIYLTTLWTAWTYSFNMMPYITQFGFLPLLILSIYLLFDSWSYRRLAFVIFASLLFTATSVIATLFFVDLVIVLFFIFLFGHLYKYKIKRIVQVSCLFIITQLFWLLPFVGYTISTSNDVINSYTNKSITASTIDLEKQMMTLENSARFYTRLLGTTDDPSQGTNILTQANNYTQYDFYKIIAYLPIFLAVIGLLFCIVKKKYKILPLWLVLFATLFLLKNQNVPLGNIYIWLQDNIHIFKEVFRWVSSKLCQPYLIFLTIAASIGFLYLIDFLGSFIKGKWRYIPIVLISVITVGGLLFYSEYLFTGDLFTSRATVTLPNEYYELQAYLKDDTDSRIYYAPPANNGYFREYNWGFVGSQFLGYILPNPLMDMSLSVGSDKGESAMLNLENTFESGNEKDFNKTLEKYDVKYVLVDRSLVKGRYGRSINWDVLDSYTTRWKLVWKSDFLELYTTDSTTIDGYTESTSGNIGTFSRTNIQTLSVNPLSPNLEISKVSSQYITKIFKYSGNSLFLSLDPKSLNQDELPTTITIENGSVKTLPAIPIVADLFLKSRKTFGNASDFGYLVAGDKVFTKDNVINGVTIQDSWKDINTLLTTDTSNFVAQDLTGTLKTSTPGDCSGDKYSQIADIVPVNIASGFVIEGNSKLPCVSSKITLDAKSSYVGIVHLNWESAVSSLVGVCLYSNNSGKCLNQDKYFSTTSGYGNQDILIPVLISGKDDISLSVYALNPSGGKAQITVRNISLDLSNKFKTLNVQEQILNDNTLSASVIKGDDIAVNIPIIHGSDTYIYTSTSNYVWNPNIASDSNDLYQMYFNNGMVQKVYGEYMNEFEDVLTTKADEKYMWIWEGENISNIPASVCLTYQGDDKCWVDDTFFDSQNEIVSRIFSSSLKYTKLEASYNSTSYASQSENILKNFVVMNIPDQWDTLELTSAKANEYRQIEATRLNDTYYKFTSLLDDAGNTLLTIPQSQADGWTAVSVSKSGIHILKDTVTVNGWKQGWDISNVNFDNIYIFYWPNILGYVGYILIVSEFVYLVIKVFKRRNYVRK